MRVGFPWISLDSLVRIEAYQWVTRHKASKSFSRRFFRGERPERERAVEAMRKRQDCSWASLTWFLIFRNRLSSEPVPFGRLNPKQLALIRLDGELRVNLKLQSAGLDRVRRAWNRAK
jgi:hypothetical protein